MSAKTLLLIIITISYKNIVILSNKKRLISKSTAFCLLFVYILDQKFVKFLFFALILSLAVFGGVLFLLYRWFNTTFKKRLANMKKEDVDTLQHVFDLYIRSKVDPGDDEEYDRIINEIWMKLRETHRLRIVK